MSGSRLTLSDRGTF